MVGGLQLLVASSILTTYIALLQTFADLQSCAMQAANSPSLSGNQGCYLRSVCSCSPSKTQGPCIHQYSHWTLIHFYPTWHVVTRSDTPPSGHALETMRALLAFSSSSTASPRLEKTRGRISVGCIGRFCFPPVAAAAFSPGRNFPIALMIAPTAFLSAQAAFASFPMDLLIPILTQATYTAAVAHSSGFRRSSYLRATSDHEGWQHCGILPLEGDGLAWSVGLDRAADRHSDSLMPPHLNIINDHLHNILLRYGPDLTSKLNIDIAAPLLV